MIEQKELDHDENTDILRKSNMTKIRRKWRIVKRLDIGTDMEHFVVPQIAFVLADNRDEFIDSRLWGSIRQKCDRKGYFEC